MGPSGQRKKAGHYAGLLQHTLFSVGSLLPTAPEYQIADFGLVTSAGDTPSGGAPAGNRTKLAAPVEIVAAAAAEQ
jgi:hypothetical protein